MNDKVSIPELEAEFLALNEAMLKILDSGTNRVDGAIRNEYVLKFKHWRQRIEEKLLILSGNCATGQNIQSMIADMKSMELRLKKLQKSLDFGMNQIILEKKSNFEKICKMSDDFLKNIE